MAAGSNDSELAARQLLYPRKRKVGESGRLARPTDVSPLRPPHSLSRPITFVPPRDGRQQNGQLSVNFPSQPGGGELSFSLDAQAAKQMAALQAASLAKAGNRSAPGGTSVPYFGGLLSHSSQPLPRTDLIPSQQQFHFGGPSDLHNNPAMAHPPQAMTPHQQQQLMQLHQKKRQFVAGLANIHLRLGNPLPPELTGMPWPAGYDPTQSPWKVLEVARGDVGVIRLAGKELDLYKLWAVLQNAGGGAKVEEAGQWPAVLRHLGLPEQYPVPRPNGQQSVAVTLSQIYRTLFVPFEEIWRKNLEQQRAAMLAGRGPSGMQPPGSNSQGFGGASDAAPGPSHLSSVTGMRGDFAQGVPSSSSPTLDVGTGVSGSAPSHLPTPQLPQHPPTTTLNGNLGMPAPSAGPNLSQQLPRPLSSVSGTSFPSMTAEMNGTDGEDAESRKRKMRESEELGMKRVRQRTVSSEASDTRASVGLDRASVPPAASMNGHAPQIPAPTKIIRQPSRRRIEYTPFRKPFETAGGRDLAVIQAEHIRAAHRPLKDITEWGMVDMEALTMSLRSRLSTELSYALTTFTILSTLKIARDNRDNNGFPILQAPDLLEELVDILEDFGFRDVPDNDPAEPVETRIKSHRELVNAIVEDGARPFAGLESRHGYKDADNGPRPRRGETLLAVSNIIRNLSMLADNWEHLAKHEKLLTILFRLCMLSPEDGDPLPKPASAALSLQDLLAFRKDVLYILTNLANFVDFLASPESVGSRNARRAFEFLSSFLIDPTEAISPFACMLSSGISPTMHHPKPSTLADVTLDVFTRLFQPDENRRILSKAVSAEWIWHLLEALIHRLPVSDSDFQVVMRDVWLGYVEKIIMAVYALAFLASPALKRRIKADRRLAATKVLLRLVKKFSLNPHSEARAYWSVSVRRAIETLKVIDDGADAFDTSQSTTPTLMFGMGYGEHGETRAERGMGLLSGYQDEITWGLMLQQDFAGDTLMFNELESLARVDRLASAVSV